MPRISREEPAKQIAHAINRGVERRPIFLKSEDYGFFMTQSREVFREFGISLLSYCLMPNHYHFLVAVTGGVLGRAMQVLQTRYAVYFNRVYSRVGHLFQGRFKSFDVADADYLAWLPVYIHMNPVRAGLVAKPGHWEWSGHDELISDGTRYLDLSRLTEFGLDPLGFRGRYKTEFSAFGQTLPMDSSLRQMLEWSSIACGVRWQDVMDGARGGPFTKAKLRLVEEAQIRGFTLTDVANLLGCAPSSLRELLAASAQERGQTF